MTKKYNHKTKFFNKMLVVIAFVLSLSSMFGVLFGAKTVFALSEKVTSWSNLTFSSNNNLSNVYTNPTGWTLGFKESKATSGAINLDKFNDSFYLEDTELPKKRNSNVDDHVLMINSKSSTSTIPAVQYYTNSSSLTLEANSSYKILVRTKVLPSAMGSIYITGLDETIGFEKINNNVAGEWTTFTFYISTGSESESIKTELWLGSKVKNVSTGAVFFDDLEVHKLSNDETPNTITAQDKLVSTPENHNDNVKYVNLKTSTVLSEINGDFENQILGLDGWKKTSTLTKGSNIEIMDLSADSISKGKGIESPIKTDLSKGNKNALVLYTTKDETGEYVKANFGIKSPEIQLGMYETYKITANVKVVDLDGGSAYIKFVENDVKNANGDVIESITPATKEIAISSNSDNKLQNNYTTVSFFVKGRSLYSTSYNLEFALGSSETKTSGAFAIDNISVELISDEDYTSAKTDSNNIKIDLQDADGEYGITNATFNGVKKSEKTLTYPLIPESWTHAVSDKNDVFFGVVNTNEKIYNGSKSQFGNFANPGNPEGFLNVSEDTNNILLMHNFNNAYQSVKSTKFNVDANKYYKLSFDYQLIARSSQTELLNIYVEDEEGSVLYADENITPSGNVWKKYNVYISTNSYSNELTLKISLGTKENQVKGLVYVDNVTVLEDKSMTKADYEELYGDNLLDFQEGNFNLIKDNGTNVHDALRFTGNLESGETASEGSILAIGGIVDGKNTEDEFDITNSPSNTHSLKYMMMVQTHGKATYSMTAKDSIKLTSGTYYKFTVYAKTVFGLNALESEEDYGAEFGLTGIDQKITKIVSNDWKEYTIYVNCTEDAEVNLRFAMASADSDTAGMVFFDNYSYETVEADDFNVAKLNNEESDNFLFVGDTSSEEDKDTDSSKGLDLQTIWYVIPSLILAFALIFAIVTAVMKKVKIKKWEKKKVNDYDRENTVHRDVIRAQAEKERDARVKELKAQISELEETINSMEEKHQERVKENRTNRAKGITREIEKEFKHYAKLRTAYQNRIASINKEIDNMNTPEYLLAVQHKLAVEKAKQERQNKEKSYKSKKK